MHVMKQAHKVIQDIFLDWGKREGYLVRREFSQTLPTDGIWIDNKDLFNLNAPYAAIEVLASEKGKVILGSINTLERVSPSIAILVMQDKELERRLLKKQVPSQNIENEVNSQFEKIKKAVEKSTQRFLVWKTDALIAHGSEKGVSYNV